jgi:hypothetical protein
MRAEKLFRGRGERAGQPNVVPFKAVKAKFLEILFAKIWKK